MKPISRVVVSLPAPAIMLVYMSTSVRVSRRSTAVLLDLRVEQLGHQVVGRMVGPPVDVLGEHLVAVLEQVLRDAPLNSPPSA